MVMLRYVAMCFVVAAAGPVTAVGGDASGSFKLIVETDTPDIPPLVPARLVVRLRNTGDEQALVSSDWYDGLQIKILRDRATLGEVSYVGGGLGGEPTLLKAGEDLVVVFPLKSPEGRDNLFARPGKYIVRAAAPYTVWDANAERRSESRRIGADALEVTVREPTEAEESALELLKESDKARKMLWSEHPIDKMFIYSSDEGKRVLKQLAERFPDTIYADFANYTLAVTGPSRAATDKSSLPEWERKFLRESVSHSSKVGVRSPILREQAAAWQYSYMTGDPRFFPDADWKAVVRELEQLQDSGVVMRKGWYKTPLSRARQMAAQE